MIATYFTQSFVNVTSLLLHIRYVFSFLSNNASTNSNSDCCIHPFTMFMHSIQWGFISLSSSSPVKSDLPLVFAGKSPKSLESSVWGLFFNSDSFPFSVVGSDSRKSGYFLYKILWHWHWIFLMPLSQLLSRN